MHVHCRVRTSRVPRIELCLAHVGGRLALILLECFHRVRGHACRVRLALVQIATVHTMRAGGVGALDVPSSSFGLRHADLADRRFAKAVAEDWFVVQRGQFETVTDRDLVGTLSIADRTNRATPDFIVLELAMELQKLAMLLKVIHLLFHVNGGRLLVNVKREFDILVLKALLSLLPQLVLDLRLFDLDALRVLKRLLYALVPLFLAKSLHPRNTTQQS